MANIGFINGPNSTLPTTVKFQSINFQQLDNVSVTTTTSGRTVRVSNSTTLWTAQLQMTAYTVADFKAIQAFIAQLRGSLNDFYVVLPSISDFSGTTTGSVSLQVQANTDAGATSVEVITDTGELTLKAGDVVSFSNHNKVYMITQDCVGVGSSAGDSAGGKTLQITPPLVEAVTTSHTVAYDNVAFLMIALSSPFEYNYNVDGTVNFTIEVREVL
jgi:hypothetical protein